MRLIDADALIQSLEKKHAHWHELVTEENKVKGNAIRRAENYIEVAEHVKIEQLEDVSRKAFETAIQNY